MAPPIEMKRFEELKASGDLPSPKGVALAIIRLTQREDASMAELGRIIRSDPAFAGRVIKAANGMLALGRRPVVSVQEALMVLGVPAVRTMALGFSLLSNYRQGVCRAFDYGRFWSHSLAMALAAQVLAMRTRAAAPDEMFSLGLLAHVGELALATLYPGDYERVLGELRRDPEQRLVDLEQAAFAMHHRDLSVAMLDDWGVPRVFTEAVRHFEEPERAGGAAGERRYLLLQTLVAARCVADLCLAAEAERRSLMLRLIELGGSLGYMADDLVAACERISRDWVEWSGMLQLDVGSVPDFSAMATDAPAADSESAQAASGMVLDDRPPAPDGPLAADGALRVLVVDDERAMRALLREVLQTAGYEVFEAENGRRGLEMALEVQPQVMVLDWVMPEMDGLEIIRALRAMRVGRSIYILLLTNLEDDERLIEAFEAGADDFVAKPVKPRVLAARMRAGQRVVHLQRELEREREEIRRFAAELSVTNRRLQEAALTDTLTGFPNRRYAIDRIEQEWAAATRNGRPLSCMIIDVDRFKQINDTHGHDVGDLVLRRSADALRIALRTQDVICRTGGDEFLVICPDTELDAALACAERLRAAVDGLGIDTGTTALGVSISVGVARREADMPDVDALIKRADQGAYVAKQKGRNRVATVQGARAG